MENDETRRPEPVESELGGVQPDEGHLVERARNGDREAFGALVTRYMKRAYYAALALVGSHDDALDLSQEAFARALDAAEKLDPARPFYPWVYQIVRRLSFNHLRNLKNRGEKLRQANGWMMDEAGDRAGSTNPSSQLERAELHDKLYEAMAELSEIEREVLALKEFEGLKYREIAELLEIPVGTVMSRLYAARKALAARLEAYL